MTDSTTATQPSSETAPAASVASDTTATAADAPLTEEQSEALFNEYARAANKRLDNSPASTEIAAPDPGEEDDEPKKETPAKAGVSTTEPGKTEAADAAAGKPVEEKKPAAPKEPTDDEILADVPEKVRDTVKGRLAAARKAAADAEDKALKNDQRFRSEQGRVQALEKQRAAPAAAQKKPIPPETQAELSAFEKKHPDLVKGMKALLAAQGGNPDNHHELLEYVAQKRYEETLKMGFAAVEQRLPGWVNDAKSPEFKKWIEGESAKVQAWKDSDDPEDAALLMERYYAAHPRKPAATAPAADTTAAAEAAAVANRRALQKDGAKNPTVRGAGAPDTKFDPNDPEQLFAFYAKAANARLARI